MIDFDSCIKENQWVVTASCFAGWVTGTSMSTTQSGYDDNCAAMLWKYSGSPANRSITVRKKTSPTPTPCGCFKDGPYVTRMNTQKHIAVFLDPCVASSVFLSRAPGYIYIFFLSLIKAAKWWIVPHTCVSQCHSNWQNIRHLILLRSVTAHLLIRTHIQTPECTKDLCFAINDTSRVTTPVFSPNHSASGFSWENLVGKCLRCAFH